ncbi:hypothetical protein CPB86DRAFT_711236 [Serendipita vermifera]|nr:hypothetical protein CPB86DRAFT_711236 [Serendipita vermifera]
MSIPSFSLTRALIVGINKYASPSVSQLRGAVADAEAVKLYLTDDLKVPEDNIKILRDEKAIRAEIIKGIRWLIDDPSIRQDDPILIFFAGHGGEGPAPVRWDARRSTVQFIVPHDYLTEKEGKKVHGIPDLSIARLLTELATAKGNNIVVIFDCCHSGSGTRDEFRRVRSVDLDGEIPEDLDCDILNEYDGGRATEVPKEFKFHGDASHVLLAACASGESAMEIDDRGAFTQSILSTIKALGTQNLTYDLLIRRLPSLPSQNPRCEGKNRDRYLLRTFTPPEQEHFYQVTKDDDDYILEAGEIHGISVGCDLSLYRAANRYGDCLGKARVLGTDAQSSIIEIVEHLSADISLPLFAVQTLFGQENALRVYVDDGPKLRWLKTRMASSPGLYKFVARDAAQLEIDTHKDTVTFNFVNSFISKLGLKQIPYRITLAEQDLILEATKAASLFHRYLNHQPLEKVFKEPVSIEFMKLERRGKRKWDAMVQAEGQHNLNKDNQVNLISGTNRYGMKITNRTGQNLYPYLFHFGCSDFSIGNALMNSLESFYRPPTAQKADEDISLPPNESITIGYGDGGAGPWRHFIQDPKLIRGGTIILDKSKLDIGLFKLILTTRPADLSFMAQESPFTESGRAAMRDEVEVPNIWATVLLTVVIKA